MRRIGLEESLAQAKAQAVTADRPVDAARSVLIATDDSEEAQELGDIVRKAGYLVVETVSSELDLITLALRYRPAIILTCVRLAGVAVGITSVLALHAFYHPGAVFVVDRDDDALVNARPPSSLVIFRPVDRESVEWAIGNVTGAATHLSGLPVLSLSELSARPARADPPHPTATSAHARLSGDRIGAATLKMFDARIQGISASFTRKLDRDIGEGLAFTLSTLLLAISTPLLGLVISPMEPFVWFGPLLAALRLFRSGKA